MEIVNKKIKDLVPYANNSNSHPKSQILQIAASIKEFGFTNPVLTHKNIIVAGHGRVLGAEKLGMEEVPTIALDYLSDDQRKALTIADNRIAQNTKWDTDILDFEVLSLSDLGFDIKVLGFDNEEINDFLLPKKAKPEKQQSDEVQKKTTLGDVWSLGDHKILCSDSTNSKHFSKFTNINNASLLLTDPPYGVDYEGKTKKKLKIKNDLDDSKALQSMLSKVFVNCESIMGSGAVFYVWYRSMKFCEFKHALTASGLLPRHMLVWIKSTITLGGSDYQYDREVCFYGWKKGNHFWGSDRKQRTTLHFDSPNSNRLHPTMKPIDLLEYQINNSSQVGDTVIDPFLGSGSTLLACENTGRKCLGIELDPPYVDVIIHRWESQTGQRAKLVENIT